MPAPRTEKEVKGFLGRLNYIARFISHLTATCEPIFKLLKKDQVVRWNDECQAAFERIKEYLQEPPIRMLPVEGRPLILYLTVLDNSMGACWGSMTSLAEKSILFITLAKSLPTARPDTSCSRKLVVLWHGLLAGWDSICWLTLLYWYQQWIQSSISSRSLPYPEE